MSPVQMVDASSSFAEISNMAPFFTATPALMLAETEAWVQPTALLLGPFLNFLSFAMVCVLDIPGFGFGSTGKKNENN